MSTSTAHLADSVATVAAVDEQYTIHNTAMNTESEEVIRVIKKIAKS